MLLLLACAGVGDPVDTSGDDSDSAVDSGADTGTESGDSSDTGDSGLPEEDWPQMLQHNFAVQLAGAVVQCTQGGQPTQVSVPDCKMSRTSQMLPDDEGACPDCDRTFRGPFTWHEDDCQDLVPGARPSDGAYGFVFGVDQWRMFEQDEQGGWTEGRVLPVDDHGGYSVEWTETLVGEVEGCDDGPHDLGTLRSLLIFIEPPDGV